MDDDLAVDRMITAAIVAAAVIMIVTMIVLPLVGRTAGQSDRHDGAETAA